MADPIELIEVPAQRPRSWTTVFVGLVGTIFAALMAGASFSPDAKDEHAGVPGAFLPAAIGIAFVSFYSARHLGWQRPLRPHWMVESTSQLRFRFSGPAEFGLLGLVIASSTAMFPWMLCRLWLGPLPTLASLPLTAPWLLGGWAMGYGLARRFYATGKADYVIDRAAGIISIPELRHRRPKSPSRKHAIADVRAVLISQGGGTLLLAAHERGVPPTPLRESTTSETAFADGTWIAQTLGVPLLRQRSTAQPISSRQLFPKLVGIVVVCVYLCVLTASLFAEFKQCFGKQSTSRSSVVVPGFTDHGGTKSVVQIAFDDHPAQSTNPPIILLHGSPGNGSELSRIAAPLQAAGYRVITPDLPGFGDSTHNPPSLSILAHAHEVLALMDHLHIQRAHILGWSLGGGVAMHMADLAPDRIASLTLLASISDQESEGTRSYFAEHAKYALGYAAATAVRYTIPHFGYLSHLDEIRASMLNFWDTDMRPLQGLMRRIKTPTLILHGTNDPLVPRWAAEHSHEIIRPSTLVMTPYSHFLPLAPPFGQSDYAAAQILPFITRHNTPGTPALHQYANLAPERPSLLGAFGNWAELQLRQAHWLTLLAASTALLLYRRRTVAILLFLAVYFALIDNGIAFGALLIAQVLAAAAAIYRGRSLRKLPLPEGGGGGVGSSPRRTIGTGISTRTLSHWQQLLTKHPILRALASRFIPNEQETTLQALAAAGYLDGPRRGVIPRLTHLLFLISTLLSWPLWTLFYLIATILSAFFIIQPLIDRAHLTGLVLGIAITIPLIRSLELLLTTTGRRLLRIRLTRLTRREYWPSHLLYYPTAPYFIYLGLKHAPIAFTACNPGIEHGGGLIGESKQSILDAMPDAAPWILKSVRIGTQSEPSGASRRSPPSARIAETLNAIASNPALNYPVILKPDSGYRGHAVKLARSEQDIRTYFYSMLAPAILQQYHAGPQECGILWARNPKAPTGPGFIFSITRKEFPILTGNGRHTFEQLIFRHKRFHAQAGVFLSRHAEQRTRILKEGETLRLAESGNHCQGTLFLDGEDLITPELSAAIDSIAQGFRGGLDIGRFDIRYESDERLRQGKGFAILELNGITGESTNIYDPRKSLWWAYKTHFRQWRLMYELGMTRMAAGHKPMSVKEVFKRISTHKRSRSGSALAD